MSRIGKKAVAVPSGVTANIEGQTVKMKGPKGVLQFVVPDEIVVTMDKGAIKVDPRSKFQAGAIHVGDVAHPRCQSDHRGDQRLRD